MAGLLSITFPIFALIGLGYLTTARGVFDTATIRTLGRFVIRIALPALIFNAVSKRDLAEIFNAGYLLAYLSGSLLVVLAGWLILRRWPGVDRTTRTVCLMGMSCSNSGFIGYPIVLLTFGSIAGVALALNMMVENLVMIPAILAALEIASTPPGGNRLRVGVGVFRRLIRQPLVLALLAALAFALTGMHLPAPLDRTVGMVATASAPLSLFVIGGSLVGRPHGGALPLAGVIVAMKLVAHPAAVALMILLVPHLGIAPPTPILSHAAILMAAVPMMGIFPIIAQAHGREGLASLALLAAVLTSFVTLTGALALLR